MLKMSRLLAFLFPRLRSSARKLLVSIVMFAFSCMTRCLRRQTRDIIVVGTIIDKSIAFSKNFVYWSDFYAVISTEMECVRLHYAFLDLLCPVGVRYACTLPGSLSYYLFYSFLKRQLLPRTCYFLKFFVASVTKNVFFAQNNLFCLE